MPADGQGIPWMMLDEERIKYLDGRLEFHSYIDDFHLIFFVTHKYRAVHATDIRQILIHETYRQ